MKKYKNIIIILIGFCLFIDVVYANVICNDGSISPSCSVCSRGCCSHHGGCSSYKTTKSTKKKSTSSKIVAPNQVENLEIVGVGTNNVKLSWNKVSSTGYVLYMNNKKVATIKKNKIVTYNKTKLKANTTYKFKVRAYKVVNGKTIYGKYSNEVITRTSPTKPKVSISIKDYNSLNIKVSDVKGASKYIIQRSIDNKKYIEIKELPTATTYVDELLITGKIYYYRVKACNSYNNCSGWVLVSKKTLPKVPSLSVKSNETKKVNIVIGKVNFSNGYEVYRSTSKNGKYSLIKNITSEDELIFVNSTKKGRTYYYKVRSYIIINNKKVYSVYSNIKSVKSK